MTYDNRVIYRKNLYSNQKNTLEVKRYVRYETAVFEAVFSICYIFVSSLLTGLKPSIPFIELSTFRILSY